MERVFPTESRDADKKVVNPTISIKFSTNGNQSKCVEPRSKSPDQSFIRSVDTCNPGIQSSASVHHDLVGMHSNHDESEVEGLEHNQVGSAGVHSDMVRTFVHEHFGRGRKRNREQQQLIHLRITPDVRLTNEAVEQFTHNFCIQKSPMERWNGRGFNRHPFVSFETIMRNNKAEYVVTVLEETEAVARKAIETTWPRAEVKAIPDPLTIAPTKVASITLKYHYCFAIKVDRRENHLLLSQLETLRSMVPEDEIYIQVVAVPAPQDWYQDAVDAYERFKKGEMPLKFRLDKEAMAQLGLKAIATPVFGTVNVLSELITGSVDEPLTYKDGERALMLRDRRLRTESAQKTRGEAYQTAIRVGIVCSDPARGDALMRMVTTAFRELDGDNQLVAKPENVKRGWKHMQEREIGFQLQKDYLSIGELSRLHILPSGALQEKYKIESIKQLETDIQTELLAQGLYIGTYEIKGKKQPVYFPLSNLDYLCLPRVVIGGMGAGKTKGFGANIAVEAVRNGFGSLVIDPAKGEMGDEIEAALPADKVRRIRLGKVAISLDFCEVKHSPRARSRLAKTVVSFFNSASDEAGAQTSRYLKAAVMGMQTGKLSEVMRILEDDAYRAECIELMRDSIHRTTLISFGNESAGRRNQIMAPIYNRLDIVFGDEYLEECMDSDNALDMVEILSDRRATIIDVPKTELGPEGVDLIVNLLTLKLDLAMTLRAEEDRFPFFVVYDEPHQFLKSAQIWKALAVESRKWRVAFTWMFHSWEQIPNNLTEIIKAAGPHYTLYRSSKKTFRDLAEEILPFTVEDALNLQQFHAINVLKVSDDAPKPFICHMATPPSERRNVK